MDKITVTHFRLFASCIVVPGKSNSLIYDIERQALYDLPNDFVEILEMSKREDISTIKKEYNNEQDELIDMFFNQFVENEIGFYTNDPNSFPDIALTWESPYVITNSIIELTNSTEIKFEDIISQLNSLACRAIQLRCLNAFSNDELSHLIKVLDDTRINHIELLFPYGKEIDHPALYDLIDAHPRLNKILIYGAPHDAIIDPTNKMMDKRIIHFKKNILIDSKETIKAERFIANIEVFTEAQSHNLGLNRKVCIDKNGEIKNYLSHKHSFGNIKNDKIKDVISKKEFQEKWFISNDKIEICNTCQYRYVCVSNSDIKKENNKYYKIDMCNFDSLSNKWIEN